MKKDLSIKSVIALTVICLVTALALSLVNYVTSPIIEKNEQEKENEALRRVLPAGDEFSPLNIESMGLDGRITAVYRAENGEGYVFKLTVKGYKSGMTLLCGVGADGKVDGAVCLSSSETMGHEKTYGDRFDGKDISSVGGVDTVSGATKTTSAYREAVKLSLEAFNIIENREEAEA